MKRAKIWRSSISHIFSDYFLNFNNPPAQKKNLTAILNNLLQSALKSVKNSRSIVSLN